MKRIIAVVVAIFLLSACQPEPNTSETKTPAPKPVPAIGLDPFDISPVNPSDKGPYRSIAVSVVTLTHDLVPVRRTGIIVEIKGLGLGIDQTVNGVPAVEDTWVDEVETFKDGEWNRRISSTSKRKVLWSITAYASIDSSPHGFMAGDIIACYINDQKLKIVSSDDDVVVADPFRTAKAICSWEL